MNIKFDEKNCIVKPCIHLTFYLDEYPCEKYIHCDERIEFNYGYNHKNISCIILDINKENNTVDILELHENPKENQHSTLFIEKINDIIISEEEYEKYIKFVKEFWESKNIKC